MTSLWKQSARSVPSTPFAPGARHDVIVVGAGVTGLVTGLLLAERGRDVAIVESGGVAELSTGGNTGKVSLLQGGTLAKIRRSHPAYLVRAYVDANRDGASWLAGFAEAAGIPVTRRTDHAYAQSAEGLDHVREAHDAAREAGLATRLVEGGHLPSTPFPSFGAVSLDDQLAVDPVRVATALADAFIAAGGTLHTGTRVTGVSVAGDTGIRTDPGPAFANDVVLATGTPIIDRGLYFAKTSGYRSYAVAFDVPGEVPEGMYLSLDSPTRSIRPVSPSADGPAGQTRLVVGGNGHPVGRPGSGPDPYDDLVAWTSRHFPGALETARWSAQDYESHNLIPFVGAMPRSLGRIRFATGYAKWGLSNGPAAALRLVAEIDGVARRERPRWMTAIGTRLTVPADLGRGIAENARVAVAAAKGWTDAETQPVPVPRPAEGAGVVAHRGGRPVGISTVDGTTRAVSAVCTHLGGVITWNADECTWDCPLHASRFAPDGTRLEGPAVDDLSPVRPRSGVPRGR